MGTVAGLFDTWGEARQALEALRNAGFRDEDLSVVGHDRPTSPTESTGLAQETAIGGTAALGAAGGGFLGGLAGLVVGLGALTIPGIGPALAAGPLSAALAGGALGVAAGGLLGALVEQGIPAADAHDYQEAVERGGILLTVNAPIARAAEARTLLRRSGMRDLIEHRRRREVDPGDHRASRRDPSQLDAPAPAALEKRPTGGRIDEDHEGLVLAGGASGAVVGGIIGGLAAGPVGAAVGVAFGAAAGGASGAIFNFSDVEPEFYDEWGRDPQGISIPWEQAGLAYRHGWEGHDRPELRGRTWEEAHPDLKRRWDGALWSDVEPMVRSGWNRRAWAQHGGIGTADTRPAHGPAIDAPAEGPSGPASSDVAIPRRSES